MPKEFDIREELHSEPVAFSTPQQVKDFITVVTNRQGAVKTLNEVLILKSQRNGDGFLLQAPRAKDVGGRYYLDEKLIEAVGSDFYSASDSRSERLRQRMEVVIPRERLDATLEVLMGDRDYTLAAFELKEIARDYLGIRLPELEAVQAEPLETQSQSSTEAVSEPFELFDTSSLSTIGDYAIDTAGYDPTWDSPSETGASSMASASSPGPSNIGTRVNQVRDADLEIVAANLGLERDRHDLHKWRDANHIISINNGRFMDWLADQGGGGAIDLVMHVQQVDFQQAVQWLSRQDLSTHLEQSHPISEERQPLQMPVPNENRWAAVRNYLVETRKLPSALVDRLHQRDMIYADVSQNAVFVRHATHFDGTSWQRQNPTGASLRSTWGKNNSFLSLRGAIAPSPHPSVTGSSNHPALARSSPRDASAIQETCRLAPASCR
ncbi:MAG: DUF3991 domain-containing protein [Elainellaceae cyanobacterium]